MDRKVGFLANHVKMIRKEQNLVVVKMLLKELNKDADRPAVLVKLIRKEREVKEGGHLQHELARSNKKRI